MEQQRRANQEAAEQQRRTDLEAAERQRKANQEGERQHVKQQADEQKAADKQEKLARIRATFESKVTAICDPEKMIGNSIETGISAESLRKKVTELKNELKGLE